MMMNIHKRLAEVAAIGTVVLFPASVQAANNIQSQTNFNNLSGVVEKIFSVLIWFLPAVATIYLAISGYRYIVAQGSPDLIEKAKKSLTYAVFGVVISYSAFLIMLYLSNALGFKFTP